MKKMTAEDALTVERLKQVFSYSAETGLFTRIGKEEKRSGWLNADGYVMQSIDSRTYYAHRLAWLYVHWCWPAEQLDHINGVRSDYRIANLREATHAQNHQNQGVRKNNTSGATGVYWDAELGKWYARIMVEGKSLHLGTFAEKSKAIEARADAKAKCHPFNPVATDAARSPA